MENSKVYFTDLRTTPGNDMLTKLERLVRRAGIADIDFNGKFTAIKIHFGEPGNLAYIRPNYAARIVDVIRSLGGKPFLTDSNTLYTGGRSNAVDHLSAANENGFNRIAAHADVIIADGLKGTDYKEVSCGGTYCPSPKIGAAIADADIVISMNHFKGHEQSGFGGALKNLGMGCGSRAGKMEMHSAGKPFIKEKYCIGCGACESICDAVFQVEDRAVVKEALATENNDFDNTARKLTKIPGFIIRAVVGLLNFLDYHGWLPKALLKVSPFHGSMIITSMGSLGIPAIYHHIYDFGNLPVFISYGSIFTADAIKRDGTRERHHFVTLKVVTDERICDGYYYATFFKYYRRLLAHPEVLDLPPEAIVKDID